MPIRMPIRTPGRAVQPDRSEMLRRRRRVAWTFALAFALHDLEEVLAAGHWERHGPSVLRRRFPSLPDSRVARFTPRADQMRTAIAVVSLGVAAASASALLDLRRAGSARVEGGTRDPEADPGAGFPSSRAGDPDPEIRLLQAALAGFTVHGFSHLASAVAVRGYVPGVVTTPLVILPYSVWAWRTLRSTGLPRSLGSLTASTALGAALVIGLVGTAHVIGRRLRPHP